MESLGSSNRASVELQNSKGTKKTKRRHVSRAKSEQGRDTPTHETFTPHPSVAGLSREERIKLYMSRIWVNPENDDDKRVKNGKNNLPVNIFTGEEYKEDEIKGTLFEGDGGFKCKKGTTKA